MRLLLDTHVLIWAISKSTRLARTTAVVLVDRENDVLFSAASIWEIAIKAGTNRLDFSVDAGQILDAARTIGFLELPVHASATTLVATLPKHHRDPFDRLLVAQAIAESALLFTADRKLLPYSPLVTLVD